MKRIILSVICTIIGLYSSAQNIFWNKSFWNNATTLEQVKHHIEKGNSPTMLDSHGYDATTNAIIGKAPVNVIRYLLDIQGNDINKITHDGRTYLFWASASGETSVVELILSKGANINATDEKGYTALLFAANRGKNIENIIQLLIKNGADIHSLTPKGANALLLACLNVKRIGDLHYFVQKGLPLNSEDSYGRNAIDYASQVGNQALIRDLISAGIALKKEVALIAGEGYRRHQNNLAFFKFLKTINADFSTTNSKGENILHILALHNTQTEVFSFALSENANLSQTDNNGNTPLMNATIRNTPFVVKLILEKTPQINHKNKSGKTALTNAVEFNTASVVELLLKKGANVQILDQKKRSLAYYLINSFSERNKDDFYKKWDLLQQYGLDMTALNGENYLLHWAIEKNNADLIQKIATLPLDINQKNNDGLTPLHKAIMTAKDTKIIQLLIKLGADIKITTDFGETPFDLAQENETLQHQNIQFLK